MDATFWSPTNPVVSVSMLAWFAVSRLPTVAVFTFNAIAAVVNGSLSGLPNRLWRHLTRQCPRSAHDCRCPTRAVRTCPPRSRQPSRQQHQPQFSTRRRLDLRHRERGGGDLCRVRIDGGSRCGGVPVNVGLASGAFAAIAVTVSGFAVGSSHATLAAPDPTCPPLERDCRCRATSSRRCRSPTRQSGHRQHRRGFAAPARTV